MRDVNIQRPGALHYLRRKFNNFRRDPMHLLIDKVADIPRDAETWARLRLDHNGVLEPLVDFVAQRPRGALAPVFTDLWFLYRNLRKRRPSTVLEFGSGCSTVALAKALFDNGHGYLYAIESSAEWANSTSAAMPQALGSFFEIIYSPVESQIGAAGKRLLRHRNLPRIIPDFVFLDGPPLRAGEVAADLLDLEDQFPPGLMLVIDKRNENTEFLIDNMRRHYAIRRGRLSVLTLIR